MTTRILSHSLLSAALLAALGTLAACSSVPDNNVALEQARARFGAAQANPEIARLAPDELNRAGESLRRADQASADHASLATVDHLAYMASQRVTLAQDTALSKSAQAITAGAGADRDRMRLALRTQEADRAQQKLAMAQQNNARKNSELAAAGSAVAAGQARVDDLETQLRDLNAKKTERGMVVTLGDVLFDSGKAALMADGARNMGKLADFFKRYPQRKAAIEGYTDSQGGAEFNMELSQRRADAVMAALVNMGVPADRLTTHGFGEASPTASNATAAGRQLNRRVEIVFGTDGA